MFINYRTKSVHKLYAILIYLNTQHQNNDKYKVYTWISFFWEYALLVPPRELFGRQWKLNFWQKRYAQKKMLRILLVLHTIFWNIFSVFKSLISRSFNLLQEQTGLSFKNYLAFVVDVEWLVKDSIGRLEDDKQE